MATNKNGLTPISPTSVNTIKEKILPIQDIAPKMPKATERILTG